MTKVLVIVSAILICVIFFFFPQSSLTWGIAVIVFVFLLVGGFFEKWGHGLSDFFTRREARRDLKDRQDYIDKLNQETRERLRRIAKRDKEQQDKKNEDT